MLIDLAGPPLHLSPVALLDTWPLPAVLAAFARARDWRRGEVARETGRLAATLQGHALIHGFDDRGRRRAEQFDGLLADLAAQARELLEPEAPGHGSSAGRQHLSAEQLRFFAAARLPEPSAEPAE